MTYTQEELTNRVYEKVFAIYDIFKNHFGEDKVDLQGLDDLSRYVGPEGTVDADDETVEGIGVGMILNILVWWPSVTVTNENDKSIVIQDLYAKIPITVSGTIPMEHSGFRLTRATYSKAQYMCNYLHSHAPTIPSSSMEFVEPCLGSGPIRGTINNLKMQFDEAFWMLFCQELSLYVTVESLTGVPYHKLEEVGMHHSSGINDYSYSGTPRYDICRLFDIGWIRRFVKYYLEHGHLAISYSKCYTVGTSFQKFMIDISNSFIEYYNQCITDHTAQYSLSDLQSKSILSEYYYVQGEFRLPRRRRDVSDNFTGRPICRFKGNIVYGRILGADSQENEEHLLLLNESLAMYCLEQILQIINFNYTNKHDSINNTRGTEDAETSNPHEKIIYL